jgi:uncharacterized protein (DUF1778 family)
MPKAAASAVIESECIYLDAEQTRFVLDLLDNPPEPNARLLAAAKRLVEQERQQSKSCKDSTT